MKIKPDLKEDIISFTTSKLAHKASFVFKGRTNDWLNTTLPYHEDGKRNIDLTYQGICYPAPTQSLLQKWLRVKHNLLVEINYRTFGCSSGNGYFYMVERKNSKKSMNEYFGKDTFHGFETYEEAMEVGLQQALTILIVKNRKK